MIPGACRSPGMRKLPCRPQGLDATLSFMVVIRPSRRGSPSRVAPSVLNTACEIIMPAFTHHVFICGNVREPGHRRGCCDPRGQQALKDAFKAELKRAGLGGSARANHAGCLDQCEHGPTVVIYPQGIWYGKVTPEDVPRIVSKTLVGGEILADLLIPESCLNNPSLPSPRP